MADTFLFHDYETFGIDPARDGIAQIAFVRTDTDLKIIDEAASLYCRPVVDRLPHPESCLITGITPQHANTAGLLEADFAARIYDEMTVPGTCSLGYNSIRFDDAFTRHLLWRNFYDPYVREWKNGNSRFDLIDLARHCYALRPDGIEWPLRDDGKPSFRLEHLASANDLEQSRAHDAASDVSATLGLARLIRTKQPRLWNYALGLRDKQRVRGMLDWARGTPLLHTSEKYGAERGCTSLVLPMGPEIGNDNAIIVIDLMADPAPLLQLDAEELRDRLFTPRADLPEDVERPAIKSVHINRCPMLAPLNVLQEADTDRIRLDPERCERHRQILLQADGLHAKLASVISREETAAQPADIELSLYSGGFVDKAERTRMDRVRATPAAQRGSIDFQLRDPRHVELLFRQRARNWPDTLTGKDSDRWRAYVSERLSGLHPLSTFGLEEYRERIAMLRMEHPPGPAQTILDQLDEWGNELARSWL